MKINYIKGDLFETDCDVIAHGCNRQGVMGSGVAKVVKEKYPEAYDEYKRQINTFILGSVQFIRYPDGKIIANCITQENYGRENKQYVDYEAIKECMWCLNNQAKKFGFTVAMPKIGAGLGGGDWDVIEKIIEEQFVDVTPNVYVL